MRILGIETSCDETAAAVVEGGTKILTNVVASSAEMQAKFGGVIPEEAARQQVRSIIPVIQEALARASEVGNSSLEAIAVTVGPGLIGSLLVGVETAKTLAHLWQKPLIPVNHLIAHIYANWLNEPPTSDFQPPTFPALALVVSGGHTDLVLMKGHPSASSGQVEWIGGTRDDAAGEAFDKSARLLGLPYPGGPAIAAAAANFQPPTSNFQLNLFPRPMIDEDNFDFSFSGLKTAVLRTINNQQSPIDTSRLAAEVQEAIVDVLVKKTLAAVKKFKPKSLLLAGGVSANARLREKFELEIGSRKLDVEFRVPNPKLCTDNAAYIAAYAHFNPTPAIIEKIEARPELTIVNQN